LDTEFAGSSPSGKESMNAKRNNPIPTRLSLLNRLKDWDDQEGWKVFFETYWRLLYNVATKSGLNDVEAQDVVQETIIVVAKKMPAFQYDSSLGSFKSWLLLITRRRIIDHFRRREREPARLERRPSDTGRTATLDRVADPAGDRFAAAWEEEWRLNILQAAIHRVKRQVEARQFQLFDACALKGWPVEEVARNLHATAKQVYNAKHRISKLIKQEVDRLEKTMI